MNTFVTDESKNVAVFVNDFDQEFADALTKLSRRLGRPLQGVVLVDSELFNAGRNVPDTNNVFDQIVCDFSDDVALRQVTRELSEQVLLLTCSADKNQPYLDRLIPFFPYVLGPTETSLSWATQKALMREMFASYDEGLTPKVELVADSSEKSIQHILKSLTFPIILKPTGLASSILVSKVNDQQELRDTITKSFNVIREVYERDKGRGKPTMLAEEFIEGDRYTTDAYVSNNGEVWQLPLIRSKTAYEVGGEGFQTFQNESLIELSSEQIESSKVVAEKAVAALGLRSCATHIEMLLNKDGWKMVEVGPRAGGQRQDLYALSYNMDHAYNELLVKVGLEPEIKTKHVEYSMTVNIWVDADNQGVIKLIDGLDKVRINQSFYGLSVRSQIGEYARTSGNGGKMIAVIVLHNKNIDKLREDADRVRSLVKVVTEKV